MRNGFIFLLILCLISCKNDPPRAEVQRLEKQEEHVREYFSNDLDNENLFYRGLAMLYLNVELEEANQLIRNALKIEIQGAALSLQMEDSVLTPEIAGSEYFKWQMRNWILVYYLFGNQADRFPERLDTETETRIEKLFWNYLLNEKNNTIRRAELKYIFDIHGSENHELMRYSNLLLAAQALKNREEYRDRIVHEGLSVQDYFQRWNAYYREYPLVRAKYGDMTELFSLYCVYTLPELFNLFDFAEDDILGDRVGMLIDLIWTDWALAQINGIRGGVKTRIYQDPSKADGREMERGGKDARWRQLSQIVFTRDQWWEDHPMQVKNSHRIQGVTRVLASSSYRLPEMIRRIADERDSLGEFTFLARRPAKQRALALEEIPVWYDPYYSYDTVDTRMLSYEFCTSDFVMGSLWIDPALPLVPSHLFYTDEKEGNKEGYPALSTQNRYHGLTFSSVPTARIIPQCMALENGVTYGQQQAVQHKNIMMVQRDLKAANTGDMRVFFSEGMKEKLIEQDSWLFLEEGESFVAVKAFSALDGRTAGAYRWDNEFFIHLDDPQSPVVFIVNRKSRIGSMEEFTRYVQAFTTELDAGNRRFTLKGTDMDGEAVSLALYLDCNMIPEVNGRTVDLNPPMIYDSPYLRSRHGSGLIRISYMDREMVMDFISAESYLTN